MDSPRYSHGIRYDPSVLREMAARLDAQATTTIVIWTVVGAVVGAGALAVVGLALENVGIGALVGLIVGGVLGYMIGEHRALMLRFEAQLALCQVAIEENTRPQTSEAPRAPELTVAETGAGADQGDSGTTTPSGEPMTMPRGRWEGIAWPGVSGRFEVMSGDERKPWMRLLIGKTVTLESRSEGVWLAYGTGSGRLIDDGYRWAASNKQPDMLLILERGADGNSPLALLRRIA